jgi:hypothetical protein
MTMFAIAGERRERAIDIATNHTNLSFILQERRGIYRSFGKRERERSTEQILLHCFRGRISPKIRKPWRFPGEGGKKEEEWKMPLQLPMVMVLGAMKQSQRGCGFGGEWRPGSRAS